MISSSSSPGKERSFTKAAAKLGVSQDTGTSAWKNMVARTRFGFTNYVDPAEYRLAFERREPFEGNDLQPQRHQPTDQDILTKGVLYFLLTELSKVTNTCHGLRITVIGHNMGAIVADEMMINFPDLPYQNIVFMAAAGSIGISKR